jgi:ketosteroid isomerase-like protein
MSQENVEIARKNNDAFRRGDWDAWAASVDPHIFVRTDANWPEQRIYGLEAFSAFVRGAQESWGPDLRIEDIADLGDRLLVRFRWIIRGGTSGVEGEQRFSVIATNREGRVVFIEYFLEHDQALEALGLGE